KEGANLVQRKRNQQFVHGLAKAVTAQLRQIQIEVGIDFGRDEFVAGKRDVAEAFGGIARRVDRIVLHATAGGHLGLTCFNEGRERARQTQTTSSQILLGEK